MYTDQTNAFRALLPSVTSPSTPSTTGPNGSGPSSRSTSPINGASISQKRHKGSRRQKGESEQDIKDREEEEAFMAEAYRIHNHLSTLRTSLTSTRKAYLSLADAPAPGRSTLSRSAGAAENRRSRLRNQASSTIARDGDAQGKEDEDDAWLNGRIERHVAYMSDKERGEVDMRGKMIVRRCRDRVALLEEGEKARQSRTLPTSSHNPILSLLSALSAPSSSTASASSISPAAAEPVIAAHRASILWTLNSLLASTSQDLVDLQEERAKRKAERVRTLGDGAEREARAVMLARERERGDGVGEGFFERALDGITGGDGRAGSSKANVHANDGRSGVLPESDPAEPTLASDPSLNLTEEQIQQFDTENTALLTHLSTTLSTVLAAEKSLLEISEMQTQLITHLAQQTEMVDTLYEQAVGSVGEMRGAKEQLVKAKERSGEARLFLLVFLIGASLGLLFLDWYS